jgi:hypothetical protein
MDQIVHSTNEMAVAYANVAHALTTDIPQLERRMLGVMEDFRSELVLQGADMRRLHDRVDRLEHFLTKGSSISRPSMPKIPIMNKPGTSSRPSDRPPPRPESDSSHDLAQHVSKEIAQRVEAEAKDPKTPAPDAAKVAAISADVMAAAITKIKAQQWDDLQTERAASARELTKFKWTAAAGGFAALLTIIAWIIEHVLAK